MQDPANYTLTGEPLTHQVIADIENFRSRESLPERFTFQWIRRFTLCSEPDRILKRCLKQMMPAYTTLMKKKKQEPEKLAVFQSQPFKLYIQQLAEKSVTVNPGQAEVKLKKGIAVLAEQVGILREEISVLRDTIRDLSNEKTQLQQKLDESVCLNEEADRLSKKTEDQKVLIQQLQPGKLVRLKQQVNAMKVRVRARKGLHN